MKKTIVMLAMCIFSTLFYVPNSNATELNLDIYAEYNNPDCKILEKDEKYAVIQSVKTGKITIVYIEDELEFINGIKLKYPDSSVELLKRRDNKNIRRIHNVPSNSAYDVMVTGNLGTQAGEALAKGLVEWIKNWFNRPLEYLYKREASILLESVYRMVKPYTLDNGWHKFNYGSESYWVLVSGSKLFIGWYYDEYYNGWYFLFPNGIMMNGNNYAWIKHDYKWYEFGDGGKLIEHSGWEKYGDHWMYYIPGDFGAVTRWKEIDGKWHYFDDNGYLKE